MDNNDLKEVIAEQIFPFKLYLSGKFNHADIVNAMCQMAQLFESFYADALIRAYGITEVKHEVGETANEEIK